MHYLRHEFEVTLRKFIPESFLKLAAETSRYSIANVRINFFIVTAKNLKRKLHESLLIWQNTFMNFAKMFRCKLDTMHHGVVSLCKLIDVEAMSDRWATKMNRSPL